MGFYLNKQIRFEFIFRHSDKSTKNENFRHHRPDSFGCCRTCSRRRQGKIKTKTSSPSQETRSSKSSPKTSTQESGRTQGCQTDFRQTSTKENSEEKRGNG